MEDKFLQRRNWEDELVEGDLGRGMNHDKLVDFIMAAGGVAVVFRHDLGRQLPCCWSLVSAFFMLGFLNRKTRRVQEF